MTTTTESPTTVAYAYRARSAQNKVVRGQALAANPEEVTRLLLERGLVPLGTPTRGEGSVLVRNVGRHRVKQRDVYLALQTLHSMIGVGSLPYPESLEVAEQDCGDPVLRAALADIRIAISGGIGIAEAFEAHDDIFPRVVLDVIAAGELGDMENALARAVEYLDRNDLIRTKIIKALIEPMIYAVVGIAVTTLIVSKVIPKMVTSFQAMGGPGYKVPGVTLAMASVAKTLPLILLVVVGVAVVATAYYRRVRHQERVREFVDKAKVKAPIIGGFLHYAAVSRFAHTLGMLLSCQVPLLYALEVAARACDNIEMERAVLAARDNVIAEGESLTTPLRREPLFPRKLIQFMEQGERTGRLGPMLLLAARDVDRDVDLRAEAMTKAIGPLVSTVLMVLISLVSLITLYPLTQIGSALDSGNALGG